MYVRIYVCVFVLTEFVRFYISRLVIKRPVSYFNLTIS